MNKYKNIKITIDNILFDSKAESRRYLELKALERIGDITHLRTQPKFDYMSDNGKKKIFTYKADFDYCTDGGRYIVEDVKSSATAKLSTFRLKKKLIEDRFGIEIVLVS